MPEISEEELAELKAAAEAKKDLEEKAKALEASKERVLKESNDYKTRAKAAEEKLSEAEKAKLEQDGKLSELLNREREEKEKLLEELTQNKSVVLKEKLRAEVAKHAKDAHNVDRLLEVRDHRSLLKIDDATLSVEGVEDFVKKVRETDPYLFRKKSMDPGDNTPPGPGDTTTKTDDEKYLEELRAASTSKELEEVKKKYGKPLGY